ncbi:MAG TPA: MFS transporter, partial [Kineosporiaceae bacterium]
AVLVDSVTTNQQRVAAFAVFRFAINVGAALGGLAGGLVATRSYAALFFANAGAALLFGASALFLPREAAATGGRDPGAEDATEAAGSRGGYREALADRRLRRFLLMTLTAEFVYVQSTVGLPLHIAGVGLTAADFGLLIGLNGVLVLLLELPTAGVVVKRRAEYVLAVGNVFTGIGLALTGLATEVVWLAATVLLWTLGEMMYSSVANAHLGGLSPPGMVGRYQGLYGATFAVGTGLGPLVGGALYAVAPWVLWAVVGVVGMVSAQLCLPAHRPGRRPATRTSQAQGLLDNSP